MPGRGALIVVAIALTAPAALAAPNPPPGLVTDGLAGIGRQQSCRTLAGGTAGAPESTAVRATADRGNGTKPGDHTDAPASLPQKIALRTTTTTYNRRYWFVLRAGRIWFKSNQDVTGIAQPWTELPTPACFEGQVAGISVDDDELIAIDRDRRVYTMDGALGDPALFNWTSRWGPLFWTGAGRTLPQGMTWSWSVVSPAEDQNWTDPAGNTHAIGFAKVSHIWLLGDHGRRLTFMDPWLPDDESYEMCGPHRGRFRAAGMSASGSTIFLVGRHGDLYTRIFDFDLSGDDDAFFDYSYEDQRGKGSSAPIQLPAAAWVHQPKIPGRITSAVSIEKLGLNVVHRTLRVEGLDRRGRHGYWEKDITQHAWRFHATGLPLQGHPLPNPPGDTSTQDLAPPDGRTYELRRPDFTARLAHFDGTCTPTRMPVRLAGGRRFTLLVHTTDGVRQTPRARGIDDQPRAVHGTLEAPAAVLHARDAATKTFVARYLTGRFTKADLQATTKQLVFGAQGWTFSAS